MLKNFDCFYFDYEYAKTNGKGCTKNKEKCKRCWKFLMEDFPCKDFITLEDVIQTLPD